MSKDPAFLFYSSDFLTETYLMTNEEVGIFIKLICLQHQFGHLTKSDLSKFVNLDGSKVMERFNEIDGKFYHMKTKEETERRKNFTESRRKNRQSTDSQLKRKNICKTHDESYVEHMETETETITKTNTLTKLEGGVGGDFNWESVKQYFFNAEAWMYKFCSSKSITRDSLVNFMQEFINDIELRNEYKPLKDLQSHFTNWFNQKQKTKNAKPNKNSGRDELLESLRQRHSGYNPQ